MDVDEFIITVLCILDDHVSRLGRIHRREPQPHFPDSEA